MESDAKPIDDLKKRALELEIRIGSIAPYARLLHLMWQEQDKYAPILTPDERCELNRLYTWWSNLDDHHHETIHEWAREAAFYCEDATMRIKRIYSSERKRAVV